MRAHHNAIVDLARVCAQANNLTYYIGPNGETSWTPPSAPAATPVPPPPPPAATPTMQHLPVGWTSAIDPSTNRVYYVNSATGATSWEHPTGRL